MLRSRRYVASGFVALTATLIGGGALAGTAVASPVTSAPTIVKSVQCPNGYQLNPQNTQQCTPSSSPYDSSRSIPPGSQTPH